MLTAKNLERMIELENKLRAEYQEQLDVKSALIESGVKALEEKQAVVDKQLDQIRELSSQVTENKRVDQLNRELNNRSDNLSEKIATQKKQLKTLQKDLADERAEVKVLKQFDPTKMKKNLDASKKKLAERTTANDLLQKSLNRTKNDKAELEHKVKELEAKVAELEPVEEAEEVDKMMVRIGAKMNKKVRAVFTSMNQPLGFTIGNALEIKEVIDTLKGQGPDDLTELCLELGSHMLVLGEVAKTQIEGIEILKKVIASGKAFEKFRELVAAQGGDISMVDQTDLLPDAQFSEIYKSNSEGYINELNALDIGLASVKLGAGRETMASKIDHGAGIVLKKKIGDYVKKDEVLALLYSNNDANFTKAVEFMDLAYKITDEKPEHKPLILKTMS